MLVLAFFCFLPAVLSHPRKPTRTILVSDGRTSIPNPLLFPNRVLIEHPRSVSLIRASQVGVRTNFEQEEPLDLQCRSICHLCHGRRIHMSGHSDFGSLSNLEASSIWTWVYADTALAACPSMSGSLAMTSLVQYKLHRHQSRLFVSLRFNLFFDFNFVQLRRWNHFELLPFLVHCGFCVRTFYRLRHKFVYQIIVGHRIVSFACDVIFVIFR